MPPIPVAFFGMEIPSFGRRGGGSGISRGILSVVVHEELMIKLP